MSYSVLEINGMFYVVDSAGSPLKKNHADATLICNALNQANYKPADIVNNIIKSNVNKRIIRCELKKINLLLVRLSKGNVSLSKLKKVCGNSLLWLERIKQELNR